jgi:peptide-methionine (S)-S-oxide reductase
MAWWGYFDKRAGARRVSSAEALPGRPTPLRLPARHAATGAPMEGPWPEGAESWLVGLGCFWGAERLFWRLPGVLSTAVGYAGGYTANPTYEEVCSGRTDHTEVVRVVFDPAALSPMAVLACFWEGHDPTQGLRQGNDVGSQYRSALYVPEARLALALASKEAYAQRLAASGFGAVTTEMVSPAPTFYPAEEYHQQYLAKNPDGYCGLGGTGVSCPTGVDLKG